MRETRIIMDMPVTLEIVDDAPDSELFGEVFAYFEYIDAKFSIFKEDSEISRMNRGELALEDASEDMRIVFALAEQFRQNTDGFFDIRHSGILDPSGLVKGWAIYNAAELIRRKGMQNFYVEAGGDFQFCGKNSAGFNWQVGIRNPFNMEEIIKKISVSDCGVATSGTYIRGQHIYNPKVLHFPDSDIVSLTVIGPEIFSADCFATAAFAMGREGISFIENLVDYEGYMVDGNERAIFTSGFMRYVSNA